MNSALSEFTGMTRRQAARRLGAGALFFFSCRFAPADEEKAGPEHHPPLLSRLHIGDDGAITVLTGKVECGQGIRTTLTQVAAEELRLPIARVQLLMGDTELVPDDGGTWGSLTTPQTVPVIRQACASLRELLLASAASEWHVAPSRLSVSEGRVLGPEKQVYSYSDLARNPALAKAVSIGGTVTNPAQWRICGTPLRPVNGPSIVTGQHRYSSDIELTGMLHGRVLRGPNYKSKLLSFDASDAERLPGVRIVRDGDFLGVTARTPEAAETAAKAIQARWSDDKLGDPLTLFDALKSKAKPPVRSEFDRYPALLEKGSVASGIADAAHKLEASYRIDYISHVPLEARAAVARWQNGKLTVFCGTQAPFPVRDEIANAFRISTGDVRVIVSDTGSGYGGKHNCECELEASRLARGTELPVRLAWSRSEEFTRSYCRPAAVMDVRSGISAEGRITAWDFHNYNGGAASLTPPYSIPNYFAGYHASESPLNQGSYRSLAAVGNTFAREMQIDEMAVLADLDPLEFRLRNIDNPRLKTVLLRAAERFGWGKKTSGHGVGYGVACNIEKGGHLALFVELETSGKSVHIRRFVAAFDAGAILNPNILSNQVEGALVQGMGAALFESFQFDSERIVTDLLSKYRVPRFTDVPEIDVILVDRRDLPSAGAGESPITVVAPAIGAALYAASGKRIRQLPMLPAFAAEL
jgi:isoquinoline 1-oxidoreductase